MSDRIKIFVSYSRQDAGYIEEDSLLGFLKGLEKENIEFWIDQKIRPGELWDEVIKTNLKDSHIALVLVSQHFLDSEYCQNTEIKHLLAHQAHLFPVILSPCNWKRHEWLKRRQFLPGEEQTIEEHFQENGPRKRLFLQIREQLLERAELIQPFWPGSPYPGLQSFAPNQAPIFFGREGETEALLQRLKSPNNRFLAVIGASGSGKSSLIAAGLIPRLGEISGDTTWPWVRLTPSEVANDPFWSLATQLSSRYLMEQGGDSRKIYNELQDSAGIGPLVEKILSRQPPSAELLVFIDQFEELFTLVEEEHREAFAGLLEKMAATPRLRTVLTLRADFYHYCLNLSPLTRLLQAEASAFPLAGPDRTALQAMILKPAEAAGLIFEADLPRRIVEETGQEPGALPLMAFALEQLYETCKPSTHLTCEAYQSFGGVKGAIATQAEATYLKLNLDAQNAFDTVFRELVDVDLERHLPTRKRALLNCFTTDKPAKEFIRQFSAARARLLVCDDPDLETKGDETVSVAHEALLTHWERLEAWIGNRVDDLWRRKQLQQAAEEWETQDRKDAYRWSHERVVDACGMLQRLPYEPSVRERDFLEPIDPLTMLKELENPATSHERRALIGVRLALLGDPRPGIGLREDGLPDIVWCPVPAGEVTLTLEKSSQPNPSFLVVPFSIAKYLITWCQYQAFLDAADGYSNPQWWQDLFFQSLEPGWPFQDYSNHPVENVFWLDAVAFCRWLSARLGYEVRLPTEWEWQWAATGGDPNRTYPWGREENPAYANTYEAGLNRTTAVGMYPLGASPIGALDMAGNLWEWCLNEYELPEQIELGGEAERVVRGGAWFNRWVGARTVCRYHLHPDLRNSSVGFRVVCSSPL
jgi:hypothetical protein